MEADFLAALIPQTYTILGQKLKPFSRGHLMLLRKFENGFVTSEQLTKADLVQAVHICCCDFHEYLAELQDPDLEAKLALWSEACGEFDWVEKASLFIEYIAEHSKCPELHEPENENRMPGAPFIQRVGIRLMQIGYSKTESLNTSWGECLHDYFASYEMEDAAKIINDDEAKHAEAADDPELLRQMLEILPGAVPINQGGDDGA